MRNFAVLLFVLFCVIPGPGCQPGSLSDRQAHVAAKGAKVMPFDLARSTHIFEKIQHGGRQQVVSDDGDPNQIMLIQEHLEEEATRFSQGDFHDPATIHGADMAGLHALVEGYARISIEYAPLEQGGEILYTTEDPDLIAAIHTWFDAQLSDHGHHARGHMH